MSNRGYLSNFRQLLIEIKQPPPNCNVFNYCDTGQGIDYLNSLPGSCNVGWGSAKCARISCSYKRGYLPLQRRKSFFQINPNRRNRSFLFYFPWGCLRYLFMSHELTRVVDDDSELPRHRALVPLSRQLRPGHREQLPKRKQRARPAFRYGQVQYHRQRR